MTTEILKVLNGSILARRCASSIIKAASAGLRFYHRVDKRGINLSIVVLAGAGTLVLIYSHFNFSAPGDAQGAGIVGHID